MLSLEEVDSGARVTHKNTGLRYTVSDLGDDEVLLSPDNADFQDLMVPIDLFRQEFILGERYAGARGRGGRRPARRSATPQVATGPKARGRIKKMVRERGFGFIRGEDGKEVFFHRSGLNASDYDSLNEGDLVEYQIQEGPRGARAENVRGVSDAAPVAAGAAPTA
jgi:CspA family cold shock protein